jgi:DNA-binding MarR family transcriptional regulator
MLSIVRARGRPRLGEIAAVMATSHQNAKQIALVLERKGMVRIVPDEDDGRMRRLEPTAAGRRGWTDRDSGDFAAIGAMFSSLPRAEQKKLRSLLERLAQSISA